MKLKRCLQIIVILLNLTALLSTLVLSQTDTTTAADIKLNKDVHITSTFRVSAIDKDENGNVIIVLEPMRFVRLATYPTKITPNKGDVVKCVTGGIEVQKISGRTPLTVGTLDCGTDKELIIKGILFVPEE